MPLEFHGNAICLSGGTGTRLKSELLGKYYPFWWGIASGGKEHQLATGIVDLDAATGEVWLKDTAKTILGSAGHALNLKLDTPNTTNLKIILVEKNGDCYARLKNVIKQRWDLSSAAVEDLSEKNSTGIYAVNNELDGALDFIEKIDARLNLGRTIFLFDPLRSVPWSTVQKVASRRINSFYRIGTEFIIFLFTSDLFLGRESFVPLPTHNIQDRWSAGERATVAETDALFSGESWRPIVLNALPLSDRETCLVNLYQHRLHSWFRYVLPLPFAPKPDQTYHLFFCSNFETGIRVTRSFFSDLTANPKYSPDNAATYEKFRHEHSSKTSGFSGRSKPLEFRILWKIIKEHEEGYCDLMCQDLIKEERDPGRRRTVLEWLQGEGYLTAQHYQDTWLNHPPTYMLNWKQVQAKLGVDQPLPLKPLMP